MTIDRRRAASSPIVRFAKGTKLVSSSAKLPSFFFFFNLSAESVSKIFYRLVARAFKTRFSTVKTLSRPLYFNRVTSTLPARRILRSPTREIRRLFNTTILSPTESRGLFPVLVRFPPDATLNDLLYDRGWTIVNGNNIEIISNPPS